MKNVQKTKEIPHVPILHPFKQCGATGKRSGLPCVQPAMKNGRCRFHGGKSTGAKTPMGRAKQKYLNMSCAMIHDDLKADEAKVKDLVKSCTKFLHDIEGIS